MFGIIKTENCSRIFENLRVKAWGQQLRYPGKKNMEKYMESFRQVTRKISETKYKTAKDTWEVTLKNSNRNSESIQKIGMVLKM